MSDYAYVDECARKAHASVAKLESLLLREPHNRAAEINLKGMMKRAQQVSEELERLSAINHIEVGPSVDRRRRKAGSLEMSE